MRAVIAIVALSALSGCLNWQESYNVAARADCMKLPDDSDRRACLDSVERNASERRADQREQNQQR